MGMTVIPDVGAMMKPLKAAAAILAGQAIGVTAAGKADLADADAAAPLKKAIGIAKDDAAIGEYVTPVYAGYVDGFATGMTPGTEYFLHTTAGGLVSTVPTASGAAAQHMAVAVSATRLRIDVAPTVAVGQEAGNSTMVQG